MPRLNVLLTAFLPATAACTAVGAWVYDDPSFALHSVTVHRSGQGGTASDSLELEFVGCNLNDYDLTSEEFTTRLAVAGQMVGQGNREQPVFLATRDTSRFSITVPVDDAQLEAPGRRFELDASTVIHTPIGTRKVIFSLRGRILEAGGALSLAQENARACRPGASVLPNEFERRVPLTRPSDEPREFPQPRSGAGLRPEPPN